MSMNEIAMMLGYMMLAAMTSGVILAVPLAGWAACCYLGKRKGW